jgi:hypothetical protein
MAFMANMILSRPQDTICANIDGQVPTPSIHGMLPDRRAFSEGCLSENEEYRTFSSGSLLFLRTS